MSKQFTIEKSRPEDTEESEQMRYRSWLDTYVNDEHGMTKEMIEEYFVPRLSPEGIEKKRKRTEENSHNPNILDLTAKDENGKIIGWMVATKEGHREIGAIYTDKDYHGGGLGSALIKRGLDFLGYDEDIELHVVDYNERAKAFYRKFGFEPVGEPEYTRFKEMPEIKMVRLASPTTNL